MEGVKQGLSSANHSPQCRPNTLRSPVKVYTVCSVKTDPIYMVWPLTVIAGGSNLPGHCAHHRHKHLLSHSNHQKAFKGLIYKYACQA